MESYNFGGKDYDDFESFGRSCGCPRPSYVRRQQIDAKMREFRSANAAFRSTKGTINIPLQFIHITEGAVGAVNAQQRRDQVEVLNNAYGQHGITFTYEENDVKVVDNADWFRMGHLSAAERAAKKSLQVGPETTLNFYTTNGGPDVPSCPGRKSSRQRGVKPNIRKGGKCSGECVFVIDVRVSN